MRTKSRLTITLPQDVLKQIDGQVDGKHIRNRSHAIEMLVRGSLSPGVSVAVILAGSKQTGDVPPALQKIGDHFLLEIALQQLKQHGIIKVILCPGPHYDALQAAIGTGKKYGVAIEYVAEPKPLGTAGALKKACAHVGGSPFLVLHGDILSTIDLGDFIGFHLQEETLATIALKPRMGEKQYGQAFMHGNKIVRFLQSGTTEGISIVNTGMYVLQPSVFDRVPAGKRVDMESEVFPQLAREGELSAFIFQGIWYDVSAPEALAEARERWG